MVNAIPQTPGKDYGDVDAGNPTPETDFYPVYKIEAMSSLNQGTYMFGYVKGSLVTGTSVGFFGEDFVEMRQGCDSYASNDGAYSSASRNANCDVGSGGPINIHQNEEVYGSVRTTDTIGSSAPWGGDVCANFTSGCPDPGNSCQGNTCSVPSLPTYQSWVSYCPMNQGSLNVNSNTSLGIASDTPSNKCWTTVSIRNNRTLTLTSTSIPYFFDTLDIPNNGVLNIQPDVADGTVEIYVRNFDGDRFNGNQVFNLNNKPNQFKIHYLGNDDLTLNGTAAMNAFIVAPYAGISVSGNFDFYGGMQAKNLTFTGSGSLHYDESGQEVTISDVTFSLKNLFQKYR